MGDQFVCWGCGLRIGEPDAPEGASRLCDSCLKARHDDRHRPDCRCDRCVYGRQEAADW